MFNFENSSDKFDPEILFVIDCETDGSKNVPDIPYHNHDFVEISIVTSGQVDYMLDNKLYNVKKGQAIYLAPGTYHKELINESSKFNSLHIGISNLNINNEIKNYINNNLTSPILSFSKYENDFVNCCNEIIKEQRTRKMGYPFMLKSLITKLIIILCRELTTEKIYTNTNNLSIDYKEKLNIVNTIVEYMNTNYMKDISLDKISKNMYLSSVYISKIFKEETGDSPINYLIKLRLSNAKRLLKEKNLTIKAVSQSVGYNDAYYFSKLFKKYYGVSPSKINDENNEDKVD